MPVLATVCPASVLVICTVLYCRHANQHVGNGRHHYVQKLARMGGQDLVRCREVQHCQSIPPPAILRSTVLRRRRRGAPVFLFDCRAETLSPTRNLARSTWAAEPSYGFRRRREANTLSCPLPARPPLRNMVCMATLADGSSCRETNQVGRRDRRNMIVSVPKQNKLHEAEAVRMVDVALYLVNPCVTSKIRASFGIQHPEPLPGRRVYHIIMPGPDTAVALSTHEPTQTITAS